MRHESTKKNVAYQMIYELLIILLPIITSPYIARVVGADGLGTYSFYYSIAYYFFLFALLGIKNYGNRSIAIAREDKSRTDRVFSGILFFHIFISLICVILYIVYVVLFSTNKVIASIMLMLVLSALFDISWFYFGIEQFKITVSVNSILKILSTILIFILVKHSSDLWIYCAIIAGSSLLSQLVLWIPLKKYVDIVRVSNGEIMSHCKPLFVLFIPAIAVSLYKYMDKIMIGSISTKVQLGFYENSEKIINIPLTVISSFGVVMLPKMTNLFSKSSKESMKYIQISMNYVMCLAFGLAGGLAGIAFVFSPVFWGEEFADCAMLISGLAITIPFNAFANVVRTQYLIPMSRDREYTITVFIGAVINLIINSLLIGRYGAVGAMWGTIIAEITVCILQVSMVREILPIKLYVKEILPYLFFSLLMYGLVRYIGSIFMRNVGTLIVQIVCGACFYLILSLVMLWRRRDQVFINIIKKSKIMLRRIIKI